GFRDFNCGELTFPGHSGHDPYIRSFREQAIGVPVFAVLDGTVVDLHDGEPDENTDNDSSKISNFIALRHANEQTTQYVHLRRGSITHQLGQFVAAGTQIGLVGSSGASVAPHSHFELQYRRQPVEPMAGPCRPGRSFFADQPEATTRFSVLHTTLSKTNFANVRPAPFDDATPTGTFRRGVQTMYYKADVANVSSSTTYELYLQRPGSTQKVGRTTGALLTRSALRATVTWAIDVDLNVTGTWNIVLEVDGQTFRRPFTVVSTSSQIVNRPPNPISATIDPFRSGAVPVCRVSGDPLADPDYEVVAYRYVWQVNGTTVRDVRSAALTDALARNLVHGGQAVSCTVTASDAVSSAQPAVAHAEATSARRRAVRSR
ncbi:MAG TPA: peptidoglycan DD-metalloendopeptidase family protein, partial [Thermoanaerobaculia bacterium]|nr:peptidoglycan DD-metalloendopeptidase family protein [Thermoanaerobaculia bacterium]